MEKVVRGVQTRATARTNAKIWKLHGKQLKILCGSHGHIVALKSHVITTFRTRINTISTTLASAMDVARNNSDVNGK